jgi:hypothetical protein
MSLCIGPMTMIGSAVTVLLGTQTPDNVKTYIGVTIEPYDTEQIDLNDPLGSFGIEYDMHKHLRLFAEHLSSPMQCDDHPGINHAGVKFLAPLSPDLTVYSGISVNNSKFDSKDNFEGPLGSIGIEYGKDLKLFAEYLSSIKEFEGGRTSLGLKYFFN